MEFVRPEIRQFVWRYSDALVGVAVSFFGIGWALSSVGFMVTLGYSEKEAAKSVDPAIYLLIAVVIFLVGFVLYQRKKKEEEEDDFFSNLDGEKVRLQMPLGLVLLASLCTTLFPLLIPNKFVNFHLHSDDACADVQIKIDKRQNAWS